MSSINVLLNGKVKSAKLFVGAPEWPDFDTQFFGDRERSGKKQENFGAKNPRTHNTKSKELDGHPLKEIEEQAYRRGFEEGKREGINLGREKAINDIKPQLELVKNLIQTLQEEKETFYHENEVYIVKLAIEIAKKIIQRELMQNPDILLYVVREALRRVTGNGRIVIQVHPDDLPLLKDAQNPLGSVLSAFEQVDFVPSEDIQRGGCVIESESGIVDAQLDIQLEQIEKSLLEGSNA